jgi:hypothetical protein
MMEIRRNVGIAPGQIGQESTTTGINSVANGVSQSTPAGISAAKDAFANTSTLGMLSGKSIHSGFAPAAMQPSPLVYLKTLPTKENHPASLVYLGSLNEGGIGDQKVMDGVSKKLTRERLDSLSNHPDQSAVGVQNNVPIDWNKLSELAATVKAMRDALNQVSKNAIHSMK